MGRTRKNRALPHPRPVEKIGLSEQHLKRRFVIAAVLLVVGVSAFAYAVHSSLTAEPGWTEIKADTGAETNCSGDFVFFYCLGAGGMSPTAENKALTALYTKTARTVYLLFSCEEEAEGMPNVRYLNGHPNEEIQVDAVLYEAFSLLQEYGNRYLYLGPAYDIYDNIFYCEDDWQLGDFDPHLNRDRAVEFGEIAAFANDPEMIDLLLLEDNKVCLKVSDTYLAYASANGIENFIDFYWMKNAFLVDCLAETMISAGYTAGSISSYDGFIRNLDYRDVSYSLPVYDRVRDTVYSAAVMNYKGPESIVYLRGYGMNHMDSRQYYELDNGEIRTPYLDIRDGLCRSAINDFLAYTKGEGCAEILLQMIPIYIADTWQSDTLYALAEEGIHSIYSEDGKIYYNDPDLTWTSLYRNKDVQYEAILTK